MPLQIEAGVNLNARGFKAGLDAINRQAESFSKRLVTQGAQFFSGFLAVGAITNLARKEFLEIFPLTKFKMLFKLELNLHDIQF